MIEHIDKYFNPSGRVDSLSQIFDLIDIKQAQNESVITLKARFSHVFARLKMGGVAIDLALQVGFMLRALRTTYQGVVQDFRLGRHSLASATLQSVVEQCMSYDKDPWKGPVGKDGKPARTPSANAAGASGNKSNPYEVMASCSFGNHMSRWQAGCKDCSERCMICHNTLKKPAHHSKDCPILKQIRLKLVKRTPGNGGDAASRVGHEAPATAPEPTPPAAPVPATVKNGGSTGTIGAFMVATKAKSYDLGDEFDYEGKYEGLVFSGKTKSNASLYPHASHITAKITEDTHPPANPPPAMTSCCHSISSMDRTGVCTVQLPKQVIALLNNPPAHSIAFMSTKLRPRTSLLVADTGATDHMIPDKSAFNSYRPVTGRRVRMGNNLFAPILGTGSAVIALKGKHILIRDCLQVPALCNPLYSLRAHQCQHGCGFIGMHNLGMYIFFPSFIVEVNTTTDCHLSYKPIGWSSTMSSIDYVQPIQTCNSASTTVAIPPSPPAIIEDKDESKADNKDVIPDNVLPTYASHWLKKLPTPPSPTINLSLIPPPTYSVSLNALSREELIQRLYSVEHITPPPRPPSVHGEATSRGPPPMKLECMTEDDIITTLHHPNSCLPPVWPYDTPNSSDTKTTYTPEELNCLTGCRRFCNYQNIISTTKDGALLNTGKFSLSLGTYATIPKAPRGKAINRHQAKYLDIVHVNIAFGNCVSVRGFKFALIFIDRATRYDWTFGLKLLQHCNVRAAFLAFRDKAGAFARQF